MKASLMVAAAVCVFSAQAFAGKGKTLCEKYPDSIQCKQSEIKPVPQLPKEDLFSYKVAQAISKYETKSGEVASEPTCHFIERALECEFTTSAGKVCDLVVHEATAGLGTQIDCVRN